jgi:hypothetical protein
VGDAEENGPGELEGDTEGYPVGYPEADIGEIGGGIRGTDVDEALDGSTEGDVNPLDRGREFEGNTEAEGEVRLFVYWEATPSFVIVTGTIFPSPSKYMRSIQTARWSVALSPAGRRW